MTSLCVHTDDSLEEVRNAVENASFYKVASIHLGKTTNDVERVEQLISILVPFFKKYKQNSFESVPSVYFILQ